MLFWAGLLMTLLAGVQLVRCVAGGGDGGGRIGDLWRGLAWWKPVAAVVVLAVYGAALLPLGFLVSTVVFLLVLMLAVDRNPPAVAVAVAVGATAAILLVFDKRPAGRRPAARHLLPVSGRVPSTHRPRGA